MSYYPEKIQVRTFEKKKLKGSACYIHISFGESDAGDKLILQLIKNMRKLILIILDTEHYKVVSA